MRIILVCCFFMGVLSVATNQILAARRSAAEARATQQILLMPREVDDAWRDPASNPSVVLGDLFEREDPTFSRGN